MSEIIYTKWVTSRANDKWGDFTITWETLGRNSSLRVFYCPIHLKKLFKTISAKGLYEELRVTPLGAIMDPL